MSSFKLTLYSKLTPKKILIQTLMFTVFSGFSFADLRRQLLDLQPGAGPHEGGQRGGKVKARTSGFRQISDDSC